MGVFNATIEVASTAQGPFRTVQAMVDTGSLYSWLPASVLRSLGIEPSEQTVFVMADGTRIRRDVAEITVRLVGKTRHTLCVFGDEGSLNLLGAVALEVFGLAVDPVNKRLVPMDVIPALVAEL